MELKSLFRYKHNVIAIVENKPVAKKFLATQNFNPRISIENYYNTKK